MKATIKEIARLAEVSRGTVDKVIHKREGVSDGVRAKVQAIIDKVEYEPNIVAKTLANHKTPVIIGVILLEDNVFFREVKKGVEAATAECKVYGVRVICHVLSKMEVAQQHAVIKSFEAQGVSALVLAPLNLPKITKAVNELVAKNIPVITINTDLPNSKRACFVGQDHIAGGKTAAELMGKLLAQKGEVAVMTSSLKVLAHKQRVLGFCDEIKSEYKNVSIVEIAENSDEDALLYSKSKALLIKHPNLRGIYLTGDSILGLKKALTELNKKIKIVTFDTTPEKIKLIKENIIDFTIDQNPFEQGYRPIKLLTEWLVLKQKPDAKSIKTKIDIRVKANIT